MNITIAQMSKDCKALGAYLLGSVTDGEGQIRIDFEGINREELTDIQKKEIYRDAIIHEFHHAISEYLGLEVIDPDGMCGGTETQEMVVVPLNEHEKIVGHIKDEAGRWKRRYKDLANAIIKVEKIRDSLPQRDIRI